MLWNKFRRGNHENKQIRSKPKFILGCFWVYHTRAISIDQTIIPSIPCIIRGKLIWLVCITISDWMFFVQNRSYCCALCIHLSSLSYYAELQSHAYTWNQPHWSRSNSILPHASPQSLDIWWNSWRFSSGVV